jgi:hypothetical protein
MPANSDKQITLVSSVSAPPVATRGDFWPSTGRAHHVTATATATNIKPAASATAPPSMPRFDG